MGILKPASGGGYVKAGFLGFAGSGKTHTAFEVAFGIRRFFKLTGPIAMFDTEAGSDYWSSRVKKETGTDLLVVKSHSFTDMMTTAEEAKEIASVLIVDSLTHPWRELCDSYLAEKQAAQRKKGWSNITNKLDFPDWNVIKARWGHWTKWFLSSPMHVIVCGRAGWEYEHLEDESGKKTEIVKSGVKLKAESEFGFEPGLVVEMQADFDTDNKGRVTDERKVTNRAIVLKDRWNLINGRMCEFPRFDFFKPHIEKFDPKLHTPVDTDSKTAFGVDAGGRDDWGREKTARTVLAEEIQHALWKVYPSQSGKDKTKRGDAMVAFWGTPSWTQLSENTHSDKLGQGLSAFLDKYAEYFKDEEPPGSQPPALAETEGQS